MIERGMMLMHCENNIFYYHSKFHKYRKVRVTIAKDLCCCFSNVGSKNFSSKKQKRYFYGLFEKGHLEHL